MSIVASDILRKFSVTTGSAGNTLPGSAATSLGRYISTTQITDATLNNLFDDISGDENAASDVEYRCFFIHNAHATLTWSNVAAWLVSEVAGGANTAIGLDTTAPSALNSASAQALTVADEQTAPTGVSFSSPTLKVSGLSIGSLPAGFVKAIWVRRTATNSGALSNDGVTLRIEGDTL